MRQSVLARIYSHASAAWLVLAAGVILSAAAANLVERQVERENRLQFDSAVSDANVAIGARINDYVDVLRGVRALFIATDRVDRVSFQRYIGSLELNRRYPGIQVIHYSRRISQAQRRAFEQQVRADRSIDPRGYPKFAIRPAGERPEYVVAEYVEPMAGNERALGLDLGGDAVRLAALDRTRDSGEITASGSIALANDPSRHPGFAMRVALYRKDAALDSVEQRRAALTGVVSTSFVVIDLMRGVLGEPFLRKLRVRIHDAGFLGAPGGLQPPGGENLMFDSDRLRPEIGLAQSGPGSEILDGPAAISDLEVGGRRWKLYYTAREALGADTDRWLPWGVLSGGLVITLLLFGLIRSLASRGRMAIELAERITGDLRKSEETLRATNEQLQLLIQSSPLAIYTRDPNGLLTTWNPAAERMYGWTAAEVLGRPLPSVPGEQREESDSLRKRLLGGEPVIKYQGRRLRRDGSPIYIDASLGPLRDAAGSASGIIAVVADITERKLAEEALREQTERLQIGQQAAQMIVLERDIPNDRLTWSDSPEWLRGPLPQSGQYPLFKDQIHPDDRERFLATRAVAIESLHGKTQEFRVVRTDGRVVCVLARQKVFADAAGKANRMLVALFDITERKQAERRQAMEHDVTQVLANAETLSEAAPKIIRTICETLDWACGAHWRWDQEAQVLRCAETWHVDAAEVAEFITATFATINEAPAWRGEAPRTVTGGLVRRVWIDGAPVWFPDVARVSGFRRGPDAAKAGLHCAFGFPIMAGAQPLGVMEFFSREIAQPDEALLRVVQAIGSQIGQFVVRKQAEERVRRLAHYDELTGLPNRSMFHQRVAQALAGARRAGRQLAILFIDLDRFKNINDTLGHDAGDRVLNEIAARLRGCLREADTVGRLGGDEFVVLLEDLPDPAQVALVAQKVLAEVARPILLDQQEVHITASIGISTYPADSDDMQGLMKNADISMYRAKEQGKNNYQFYSVQMNVHTLERLAMESDLRRALERNEFLLQYQPKIDLASGAIGGMEALIRWRHPVKGIVAPAQFIPLAEETGLIVPIGEWVLRTACAQNKAWQDGGLPRLCVAVNLSARQFSKESLLEDVARVLVDTGLAASALELEITESMVMRNPVHAVALLDDLKAMGVRLSIDDFGTGYSSLSYLKRFPIDNVKIDRSFIQDLPADGEDAAITRAIIAMAHSLRLTVIAEGVETEKQRQFLRQHGCDEMQGYLFSRPLDAEDFVKLLQDSAAAAVSP